MGVRSFSFSDIHEMMCGLWCVLCFTPQTPQTCFSPFHTNIVSLQKENHIELEAGIGGSWESRREKIYRSSKWCNLDLGSNTFWLLWVWTHGLEKRALERRESFIVYELRCFSFRTSGTPVKKIIILSRNKYECLL